MENQQNSVSETVKYITESIVKTCIECAREPASVRLMAVTKTVEPVFVNEAIASGVKLLGENRAQELLEKYDCYHRDGVEIHFIGHLQTNKVKQIVDKVSMIESLDSIALAREIDRQCEKSGKRMDCLVEVNIGSELTKSGVEPARLPEFLDEISSFERICVRGIMAIPPATGTDLEKERYFSSLYKLFVDIREKKLDNINMDFLSMGMSDDYLLAIKHGSNLVRLGTALFGRRAYVR